MTAAETCHVHGIARCTICPLHGPDTVITAGADSRLEQLLVEYQEAKPAADAATERLKTITDAIKAEAIALALVDTTRITLTSAVLPQPLLLRWVPRWELDTKRMKTEAPELYVAYARQRGSWRLGGGRHEQA